MEAAWSKTRSAARATEGVQPESRADDDPGARPGGGDSEGAGRGRGRMSLTELAEASGQAPATVYRVLSTFAAHGVVEVIRRAGLVRRAGGVPHRLGLPRPHQPRRAGARRHARADGRDRRDREPRDRRRRAGGVHQPGGDPRADPRLLPAGDARADPCLGIGKALLAYHPARGDRADRPRAGARRVHARDDHRPGRLAEEFAAIRARAGRSTTSERTEGMRCIAAPIFNEFREAIGRGVGLAGRRCGWSGPAGRRWATRVREAADRITRAIGGTAP